MSASPEMTRKESAEDAADVANAAGGPEQLLLLAEGQLQAESRAVAEALIDRLEVGVGSRRLAEAVLGAQQRDVLDHRPVGRPAPAASAS